VLIGTHDTRTHARTRTHKLKRRADREASSVGHDRRRVCTAAAVIRYIHNIIERERGREDATTGETVEKLYENIFQKIFATVASANRGYSEFAPSHQSRDAHFLLYFTNKCKNIAGCNVRPSRTSTVGNHFFWFRKVIADRTGVLSIACIRRSYLSCSYI